MSETRDDLREALARSIEPAAFIEGTPSRQQRESGFLSPGQRSALRKADALIADPLAPILAQVSALQAEVERLRDDRHKLSVALTSLTPGGSEFFTRRGEDFIADADACVAVVQERRRSHQDAMMRAMRTATEAQERLQKVEGEREKDAEQAARLNALLDAGDRLFAAERAVNDAHDRGEEIHAANIAAARAGQMPDLDAHRQSYDEASLARSLRVAAEQELHNALAIACASRAARQAPSNNPLTETKEGSEHV